MLEISGVRRNVEINFEHMMHISMNSNLNISLKFNLIETKKKDRFSLINLRSQHLKSDSYRHQSRHILPDDFPLKMMDFINNIKEFLRNYKMIQRFLKAKIFISIIEINSEKK